MSRDRGFDIIENVLKEHFGGAYVPEPEREERVVNGDAETPYDDLKALAMRRMPEWVPDLGIYKCRRRRGFHPSYEAVATWRPSLNELEQRALNLKISPKGIVDFGDGEKGYSPLNLVMAAKGCDLRTAVAWLDEKLGWSTGGPEIDIEAIKAKQEAEQEAEQPTTEAPPRDDTDPVPPPGVRVWHFGEPLPPRPPFLVPNIIPAGPIIMVFGGQWGTGKSFILDDLVVAIAVAVSSLASRQSVVVYC
jgi:hypothetical protein